MLILLFAMGFSCVLCLALIPASRWLAQRWGLVDQPDGHRKIHKQPTAVSGGLAILASCIASLGLLFLIPDGEIPNELRNHWPTLVRLLIGSVAICVLGVVDDFGRLRGRNKLLGQIVIVSAVVGFGVWVRTVHIFGIEFDLGWFGFPFTVFFLVGTINSLNLIDGVDGLLGSVGVILSLALAAMASLGGHWWAAAVALTLAGALFAFLRFNLVRASIFLGDSGSMMVGLILGTLAIHCSLKAPSTMVIALPLGLLVLPIFDTAAAIIRRKLTGRSIYTTDRGHLHHCLLRSGLSARGTVALVSFFCLLACASVLASKAFDNEWIALVTVASIVLILVYSGLFGHAEAMLIKGRFWSLMGPAGGAQHMEVRLQGTVCWDNLWLTLMGRAADLNLQGMLLDVNAPFMHEGYHARWGHAGEVTEDRPLWHAEIPMTANGRTVGRLMLSGLADAQPVWAKIAAAMKVVEDFNACVTPPTVLTEVMVPTRQPVPATAEARLEAMQS